MKFLFDFFPILLFFVAYKLAGIYWATVAAILASFLQVMVHWLRTRKFENTHLITCALITVLGGATLVLHDELFIKWKPTAVNWAFALVFFGSHFIGNKPIIRRMMEKNITLPDPIWSRLSMIWIIFFTLVGFLNLVVMYHFDTDTWVNFKLFGMLGITLVFIFAQAIYMARYVNLNEIKKNNPKINNAE